MCRTSFPVTQSPQDGSATLNSNSNHEIQANSEIFSDFPFDFWAPQLSPNAEYVSNMDCTSVSGKVRFRLLFKNLNICFLPSAIILNRPVKILSRRTL